MENIYHIREGGGKVTESSLPEVAHLIHMGRLKYTGQKLKHRRKVVDGMSNVVLTTYRYYVRVNREPMTDEVCLKPCCAYLRSNDENC